MLSTAFEEDLLARGEEISASNGLGIHHNPPVNKSRFTNRPDDWPVDGAIDLELHDPPHRSSATEWWYLNCHLETVAGAKWSLFAGFFRIVLGKDPRTGEPVYAHALNWAAVDVDSGKYFAESLVDPCAPEVGLQKLERGEGTPDPLLGQATREILEKGHVPHPDRLIEGPILVRQDRLDLEFGVNRFRKLESGAYELSLHSDDLKLGCRLVFHPLLAPVRHGDNGVARGVSGEAMFYYFIPRCRVEGAMLLDDQTAQLAKGSGWYDHEFGSLGADKKEGFVEHHIAWNWISAQLENGYSISAYDLFDTKRNGEGCGRWAIVVDPTGARRKHSEFIFEPLESWTSTRTFTEYPIRWRLEIPDARISLTIEAVFAAQEFVTIISKPSFWEGRVNLSGVMNREDVRGLGFIERTGFESPETLRVFLAAAGTETQNAVRALLPATPDREQARRLIASEPHDHYLAGLDIDQYARTLIDPIREIIDRSGKAWRSYALLACIDVVGGDSQEFKAWLALPELLHTGSLIVDDVEDRSTVRRGGRACHEIYGEALAINAGNAAYFLGQLLVDESSLSDAQKLRLYDLYFEALRAAHAGQAIDIDGLGALMPQVIESGDGRLLEDHVLAIHRLKSAVPVRSIAMLGAVIGRGEQAQIEGIGHYFEMIGLAFQIMDDTLNLRGFENDLKSKGEDISCGKVTMPVAKAMSRLGKKERRGLWETISSKPTDPKAIAAVIAQLESCCALTSCEEQARELVESAWRRLDPLLRDSHVKLTLRAFGWYVLDRTY